MQFRIDHGSLQELIERFFHEFDRPPHHGAGVVAMKSAGRKITMLTAYDYPTARLLDSADIDGILVGDSLGMVMQGHANTLPVTLDQMIYHAEMVGRAVRHALVIVDMPFPSFHLGTHKAIESAARILKEPVARPSNWKAAPSRRRSSRPWWRPGFP